MNDHPRFESFAVKSYRYLRLSILVVSVTLLAAVVLEHYQGDDCWQGSLSAYYYTPVQSVFVGGLVAIGVSLIAIRGRPGWEDALLNVSGILAPIVAFVPTTYPGNYCSSVTVPQFDTSHFVRNNVLAYAIGGAVALGITVLIRRTKATAVDRNDPPGWEGFVISAAMLVGGVLWYHLAHQNFLRNAHNLAALLMFAIVGVVMLINWKNGSPFGRWYLNTAASMGVIAGGVLAGIFLTDEWDHSTLILEVLEMAAFAFYWVVQTVEHWAGGIPDLAPDLSPAPSPDAAVT